MSERPQSVYILTRTPTDDNGLDGEMEIVAVFSSIDGLEKRILSYIKGNKLGELSGLGMVTHTIMES